MRKSFHPPIAVADDGKIQRLLDVLKEADGGPLKVKEVAEKMGVSANTAGKYVDICEAKRQIRTDWYGTVRRVWLAAAFPSEKQGRVG